jgi:pilus assembly protein TadC
MVIGVGVLLLAVGLLPPAPPDLRAALARLDTAPTGVYDTTPTWNGEASAGGEGARWWQRSGTWVAARTPVAGPFAAPAADLRLLGVPPVSFAAARVAAATGGLALPGVLWTLTGLAGMTVPLAVPAVVGIGLAAAGWLLPAAVLRQRAAGARAGLRVALSAYLDLVALERAGAGSPVEALEAAAQVGHGPAFSLIRGRLLLAAHSGTSPYTALADLAEEIGVAELRDLADIAAIAADGAAVYATLLAKSRSLRNAIGADAQAAANAASERLVFPVVLLGTGFLLLVFYPALARLLTAG